MLFIKLSPSRCCTICTVAMLSFGKELGCLKGWLKRSWRLHLRLLSDFSRVSISLLMRFLPLPCLKTKLLTTCLSVLLSRKRSLQKFQYTLSVRLSQPKRLRNPHHLPTFWRKRRSRLRRRMRNRFYPQTIFCHSKKRRLSSPLCLPFPPSYPLSQKRSLWSLHLKKRRRRTAHPRSLHPLSLAIPTRNVRCGFGLLSLCCAYSL